MTIPDSRRTGVTLRYERMRVASDTVIPVFFSISLERRSDSTHTNTCALSLLLSRIMEKLTGRTIDSIRRSLNYLDVVPVVVEKKELYVSSESSEASDILKSLGLPYPRIRECAHT
ncbi:MAG: hypothetical protein M1341_00930 [Candidatus Thermoplasmatota archaeon]|nr:hypothetical protein [Candidatus Thermoplasmatota archaeon]